MKTFTVEQYELHAVKYTVRVKDNEDEADAILKVLDGKVEADDDGVGPEYIEVASDYSQPLKLSDSAVAKLEARHLLVEDGVDSIRSIKLENSDS